MDDVESAPTKYIPPSCANSRARPVSVAVGAVDPNPNNITGVPAIGSGDAVIVHAPVPVLSDDAL